jgi:hypothetical protein
MKNDNLKIKLKPNIFLKTRFHINPKSIDSNIKLDDNNNDTELSPDKDNTNYDKPIRILTKIKSNYLFHYAHFMCDFMFPLICKGYHNYLEIIREKNINQTIGNFDILAKEITNKNYEELSNNEYNNYPADEIILPLKETLVQKDYKYFQKVMLDKFIKNDSEEEWPKIVLIKRTTQNILNETEFNECKSNSKIKTFRVNNGSQRRDIKEIDKLEKMLALKYGASFKMVSLENTTMEYQVNLFNNAKMIIAAHGAALINIFFCKPLTLIIEIKSLPWYYFEEISNKLNLKHFRINNNLKDIDNVIKTINIKI